LSQLQDAGAVQVALVRSAQSVNPNRAPSLSGLGVAAVEVPRLVLPVLSLADAVGEAAVVAGRLAFPAQLEFPDLLAVAVVEAVP
jgi:hypothetical protein